MTTLERILAKVEISSDGCLLWTGALTGWGYSNVGYLDEDGQRRNQSAHRALYEAFVGSVPEGHELDHVCRVRRCVNPGHLEAVTHAENVLRGARGRLVTVCARGHAYTPENTITRADGRRRCRTCANARRAARHAQVRVEAVAS